MDFFREDSAHATSSFSLNEPTGSTLEDRMVHKRWARLVAAFYVCLFLAGATAITVRQAMTPSGGTEQHASLQADLGANH